MPNLANLVNITANYRRIPRELYYVDRFVSVSGWLNANDTTVTTIKENDDDGDTAILEITSTDAAASAHLMVSSTPQITESGVTYNYFFQMTEALSGGGAIMFGTSLLGNQLVNRSLAIYPVTGIYAGTFTATSTTTYVTVKINQTSRKAKFSKIVIEEAV